MELQSIKPQELRLGNIVKYNGINLTVSGVHSPKPLYDKRYSNKWIIELFDGASFISSPIDNLSPIELTEHWLLKFGYEPTTPGYWSNGKLEIGYTTTDDNIQYEYISITNKTEMTDLKYVHQLQNLTFSLTREELKIKES